MKKKMLVCLILALSLLISETAYATARIETVDGDPFTEAVKIRCTCYTDSGTTATGCQTRDGVIAGSPDWYGCVALLYEVDEDGNKGEFIGYYEVLDTGAGIDLDGDGVGDSIGSGQSIDVWCSSNEAVNAWISEYGDYVYMELVMGKG